MIPINEGENRRWPIPAMPGSASHSRALLLWNRDRPEPPGASRAPEDRGASKHQPPLILVVEDDDDLREILCRVLEDEGYRAAAARNGLHALAQLETLDRPDLIILDLMMPVMNGWDLHARLQGKPDLRAVPVLLLSAYVDRNTHTGPKEVAGAVQKPVSIDDLLGWVRRLVVRLNRE